YPEDRVYALNANGTKKWSYATGQPVDLSSPAIGSDGTVYIGSGSKKLYALDGSTGAFKWSFTATTAVIASPVVATDGTVYFRDDTTLYALKSDGTQKWTFALAGGTYASPGIAADGTVYVGATGGNFYAINPDGAKKWATPFTANGDIYTSPAIANDGTIYFGTLNGYFYALKPDGTQKWVWDKLAGSSITSSPVLAPDGTIYFGAYDHKLHALTDNGSSASEKWSYTMGDEVRAATPAVAASGTVYMPDYDGYIYAISSSGTLVTTYATGTLLRSSPMIANGQLIVGAADGLVYAFALDPVADTAPASSPWPVFLHNQRHDGQYTANFVTITTAPVAQTFAIGSALTLSVAATGPGTLTYQWYKDGNAISGATGAIYTKSNAQTGDSGSYTVKVTSSTGPTATSAPVNITVAAGTLGRLVNLSVRTTAGTGAQTLIAGFVINGGTKSILVRGIGPTLTTYSVAGALPDPRLELYAGGASTPSYTNTAWGGDPSLTAAFTATGAFALTNPASKDTALLVSLAPGVYSAQIKGNSGDTGIALAEIYDADGTVAVGKLVNVSARAQVGTGDGILIAGFVISGTLNKTVLIRGIGPALANYGVTGSLPDPRLELYASGSTTPMNSNTGWGGAAELSAAFTATGAFALTDPNSKDTALLVSLPPGVYSAQVKGASGDTGVALIEVYEVP
ncbi:MAG: PQQ-binding-like beta-propeller repeat protein, partial [Verrucomicrobia bacterium]|nr:PQQ-binding-like beta-propeller repeat protein [Verrucomicrobiota bacterium]